MRAVALLLAALLGAPAIAPTTIADPANAQAARPITVVALIDVAYAVYHHDFLAAKHPWNVDPDPTNDIDLSRDPALYVPGFPGASRLDISLPTTDLDTTTFLREKDAHVWEGMRKSDAERPEIYYIPGTKVIAALRFGDGPFVGPNDNHGTRSASVAVGNIHGACPECLVVLISGMETEALAWAASQPWIDVVTNSYGHHSEFSTVTGRDNMFWGSPLEITRRASEEGQVILFSSGNGITAANAPPQFTYWSSEKGPDWIVTVGAVLARSRQTIVGSGRPVDISSIGSEYPSTGGEIVSGKGQHSGTSNAAPVTAGYVAKVLQRSREILGDPGPGHAGGVVARGTPVACGAAWPDCPLGDGVLTRRELQDLVFHNVFPSEASPFVVELDEGKGPRFGTPTLGPSYVYQGHGVIHGRMDGQAAYDAEWGRMVAAAVGLVSPYERPEGERAWFVADSKCRQRIWGEWSGGYHTADGSEVSSPLGIWCEGLPQDAGPAARDALA